MIPFTHEDTVTFDDAKILNSLGFDWDTHYYYVCQNYCEGNNPYMFDTYSPGEVVFSPKYKENEEGEVVIDTDFHILAPTLSQVHKWLYVKYNIHVNVIYSPQYKKFTCDLWYGKKMNCVTCVPSTCDTYLEMFQKSITYTLQNLQHGYFQE